jgi:rhodanese-related sulfurtransferase
MNCESDFPIEMNPKQASEYLRAHPDTFLLDVRENEEHAYCSIKGSLNIPLAILPERLNAIDPKAAILAYCHHGIRSLSAVRLLRAKGFAQASSIRGGIDLWTTEIDPNLPRY